MGLNGGAGRGDEVRIFSFFGLDEADAQHVAHSLCRHTCSWAVMPPALYAHVPRVVRHPGPLSARTSAPFG